MSARVLTQEFVYGGVVNDGLLALLGPLNGSALDVGCGIGSWAPALRRARAGRLVGIEPSPQAAAVARERYDAVIEAPLEDLDLDMLGGSAFAHLIAADVLEHLVDPWAALRSLHAWALPGAELAVSVPNARHFHLSLGLLLAGRFNYGPSGVMDWTHLRWFTRASLDSALRLTGWIPRRWAWVTDGRPATVGVLTRGAFDPWLAHQIQVVARRA